MTEIKFKVSDMHCTNCEKAVKEAALSVGGVKDVTVNLTDKTVSVLCENENLTNKVKDAIENTGFEVLALNS